MFHNPYLLFAPQPLWAGLRSVLARAEHPARARQAAPTGGAATLFSWEPGTPSRGMRCCCARVRPAPDTTPKGHLATSKKKVNAPGPSIDPARAGGLRML